jgi:hypothetical protein
MDRRAYRTVYHVRLALNMLWCALLLWPFKTMPRETISGFLGRNFANGKFVTLARFVDWLHPHEQDHCISTAILEARAREALYPEPENACYRSSLSNT